MWAKDLASSNGTFLNDRRIWGAHPLADGDRLRLGLTCTLTVEADAADGRAEPGWVLEDVDAGLCYSFRHGRLALGPGADVDAHVSATILAHADGQVWLGLDDGGRPIAPREVFVFDGRSWRVFEGPGALSVTDVPTAGPPPYRLVVTLDGAFGAEAVVENPATRASCKVDAPNRATLLYILGRRFDEDRALPAADRGWTPDEEVMSGIWGRKGDENKLNVLLHRLRTDLRAAGLDPWFIEKKQRFLRVRLAEVDIS